MKFELSTNINEVTVFRDGARITRKGKQKVEPGEHVIVTSDITGYAMNDSFRVKGRGAAVLKAIDVSKKQFVYQPEEDIEKIVKELKKLQKEKKMISQRLGFYQVRVEQLKGVQDQFSSEVGKWISVGETNTEQLTRMDEISFELLQDLKKKIRDQRMKLEDIQDKIQVTQNNLNRVQGQRKTETRTEVRILIDAKKSTNLEIDITYQIAYSGWNPIYDIDIRENTATLKRIAMVYNNSLETWDDIDLVVSTASAKPVAAVKPMPYYVNVASVAAASSGIGYIGDVARGMAEKEVEEAEYAGYDENLDDLIEVHSTASETISGTVIYDVPGKVTIMSEEDPHPITLTEEEFDSKKLYYWNAAAMNEVVAQDEITNGDSVILPGRVKVYAQGEFIGETSLNMIAPREEFRLGTRAAYDVKAEKKLVSKDTEKAGITRGKRRRDYEYRLEIKSFAKKAIEMRVVDVIPHSNSEKVEIELGTLSHQYKKFELGILEWEITLETNTDVKIEYEYTVSWDKDLRLRPSLP